MNGLHLGSNIYFPGRWNLRIWCSYGVKHHLEQPWINLPNLFFLDAYFAIIDFVDFHPFVCLGKKTPLLVFSLADTGLFISHLVKCSGESRRSGTIGDPDYVAPITVPEHSAGESIILAPFTGKRVTNNPFSLSQLLAEAYNLRQEDLQRQLSEDGELLWHWSNALSFYIYIYPWPSHHTHTSTIYILSPLLTSSSTLSFFMFGYLLFIFEMITSGTTIMFLRFQISQPCSTIACVNNHQNLSCHDHTYTTWCHVISCIIEIIESRCCVTSCHAYMFICLWSTLLWYWSFLHVRVYFVLPAFNVLVYPNIAISSYINVILYQSP